MAKLEKYISDLKDFNKNINKNVDTIINKNAVEITETIKRRLYLTGTDGKKRKLAKYHRDTVRRKKKKNQPYDRTTLLDSGRWYSGMFAKSTNANLFITSRDKKNSLLVTRYGENILSLTQQEEWVLLDNKIEAEIQIIIDAIDNEIELDL